MGVLQIGPGYCYIKNASGLSVPVGMLEGGTLGPFSIEHKFANGQYQMDEYAANTGIKVEGKVEFKSLDIALLLALGLSQFQDGTTPLSDIPVAEAPMTISTSTIAVTGATAVLGVRNPLTGVAMKQVTTAPAVDQYSVSGTTITLQAAQATTFGTAKPIVTYLKNATTDTNKLNLINAMVQEAVYFGITGIGVFSGKSVVYNFPRCVCKSLPLFEAKADFAKREFDVKVLAVPDLHTIGTISLSETLS